MCIIDEAGREEEERRDSSQDHTHAVNNKDVCASEAPNWAYRERQNGCASIVRLGTGDLFAVCAAI